MSLLESATKDLSQAADDRTRVEALTRIAVYLARRGDSGPAQSAIARVRTESPSTYYTLAIAGANLAEGVLAYCAVDFETAADKLKRAMAMADSIHAHRLHQWSSAWSCHVECNVDQFENAALLAKSVFANAEADHHSALARAAVTVAGAMNLLNGREAAQSWYEIARRHAVAEGDDLTIDAVLHSVAAYRLNDLRLAELDSKLYRVDVERASLELASSINYDRLKSPFSFRWMLPLLDIHLAMSRGDLAKAAGLIMTWLDKCASSAPGRHASIVTADLAYCYASIGELDAALARSTEAILSIPPACAKDDIAVINFQCARVAQIANMPDQAARFLEASKSNLEAFRAQQRLYGPMFAAIPKPARYGLP